MCNTTVIDNQNAPTNQAKPNQQGRSYRYFPAFVPFILILLISTSYQHNHYDVNYFEKDNFAPEVKDSLRNFITSVSPDQLSINPGEAEWSFIKKFYAENGYRPIWIHLKGLDEGTSQLIHLIEQVRNFGLEPRNYHLGIIRERVKSYDVLNSESRVYMDFQLEIILTDAAFRLMFNLHSGYQPLDSAFSSDYADNFAAVLLKGISEKNIYARIVSVEPQFNEYQRLRKAVSGYLTENELVNSGNPDSASVSEQIYRYNCLALNLDRLRKQAVNPDRMLWVNIPSYTLRIFEKNQVADTFRVIVGNPATPTPVLSGSMQTIIANPVWYVPKSIALNEILPKVKSDTGYLQKHGYSVLDGNYRVVSPRSVNFKDLSSSEFNYTFRQKRGSDNSLGKAKFLFSNPYSVYLHDTPSRSLFSKEKRALSHGCVRLQHPERLANYILRNINSDTTRFENLVEKGQHYEFSLNSALPIHITYITCEAAEDGSIVFYDDIYNHDKKEMENMLQLMQMN